MSSRKKLIDGLPRDPTYADVYGASNPWVVWLAKVAPKLFAYTPRELRGMIGVRATPVPGMKG